MFHLSLTWQPAGGPVTWAWVLPKIVYEGGDPDSGNKGRLIGGKIRTIQCLVFAVQPLDFSADFLAFPEIL